MSTETEFPRSSIPRRTDAHNDRREPGLTRTCGRDKVPCHEQRLTVRRLSRQLSGPAREMTIPNTTVTIVTDAMGPPEFDRARAAGRAMTTADGIAYTLGKGSDTT
jgi:hypothetical protein